MEAHLRRDGGFPESVISSYTRQLLSGLAFLHSKYIAHRDIKCKSTLILVHTITDFQGEANIFIVFILTYSFNLARLE